MAGIRQIGATKRRTSNQDRWLLKAMEDLLSSNKVFGKKGVFYPSIVSNPCDRYVYLSYNGLLPAQAISGNLQRIFDNGNYLEYRINKYFEKLGIVRKRELPIKLETPNISGRIDFIITHPEYKEVILELKSINSRNFDLLKIAPKEDHMIQIQIYLNLAAYDHGIVLYENKNDQKLKAFKVEKDPKMWDNILERLFKIMGMTRIPEKCTGESYCQCKLVK